MSMSEKTREEVALFLRSRKPFKRGNLSAEKFGPFRTGGHLPAAEVIKMLRDEPTYIVYSYDTPIAWITTDGTAYVPDVTYSVTTTRHQRIVKEYL